MPIFTFEHNKIAWRCAWPDRAHEGILIATTCPLWVIFDGLSTARRLVDLRFAPKAPRPGLDRKHAHDFEQGGGAVALGQGFPRAQVAITEQSDMLC
jgi:hypothetical protein